MIIANIIRLGTQMALLKSNQKQKGRYKVKTRIKKTTTREEFIDSLAITPSGKVRMVCCKIGCYRADMVEREIAISIIHASWPYNDYVCESCYNEEG